MMIIESGPVLGVDSLLFYSVVDLKIFLSDP
jgi:hypothetical protein